MKKKFTIALAIFLLLALILSFPAVASKAGQMVGVAGDKVLFWARTALAVGIGLFLISSGVAALAAPVVGVILIVVGLALVTWAVWPIFSKPSAPEK